MALPQSIAAASRIWRAPLLSLLQASLPAWAYPESLGLQQRHCLHTTAAAAAAHCHTRLLDGRVMAAAWQEELARDARDVYAKGGRPPGLGVVLVGSRPDSLLYVMRKREACERVGMFAEVRQLSESVTQRQLEAAVAALCSDPRIDGVLVQLPLPCHIDEEAIINSFDPQKDVDGFHPLNMGRILMRGRAARFIPCTALGVIELLQRSGVAVRGRSVVVMGDSNIVGVPLAMLFRDAGAATVTVLHRTSYRELFLDATSTERASQRAQAAACLPRIPGPVSAYATGSAATGWDSSSSKAGDPAAAQPTPSSSTVKAVAAEPWHTYEAVHHSSVLGSQEQQQQEHQQGAHKQEAAAAPADEQHSHAHSHHHGAHHPQPNVSDLPSITRTGDILVVAVGYPQLVKREWVKPGAVVIDVGVNVVSRGGASSSQGARGGGADEQQQQHTQQSPRQEQLGASAAPKAEAEAAGGSQQQQQQGPSGRVATYLRDEYADEGAKVHQPWHVVGDVDFRDVSEVASAITPVPGGVGPMTIAAVLHNTVQAARYNLGLERYDARDDTTSDDPSSRAPIALPDFRLFDSAQDILDHNKRIIKEIKSNHEGQTPEALARNCFLIRELNTNITAVMRAYRSIGESFAHYMSQNPPQQQQQARQWQPGTKVDQAGDGGNNTSDAAAAAAVPQAPPT